jgi:hypothetical protein
MTTITVHQPALARLSSEEKTAYLRFFEYTDSPNLQSYAKGRASLGNLVHLAEKAYAIIKKTNPILQNGSSQSDSISGRQWEINRLSEIKQRLANAIECKRLYYDNHFFGMITKCVLRFFGMWNNGDTAAIVKAEDFLIMYDSRLPLFKDHRGNYQTRLFAFLTPASWVRENLDTSQFYNYNPRREIPIVQTFRYDALDRGNPYVIIRA